MNALVTRVKTAARASTIAIDLIVLVFLGMRGSFVKCKLMSVRAFLV